MGPVLRSTARLLLAAGLAAALAPAHALDFSANYDLTRPAVPTWDTDLVPRGAGFALGSARVMTAFGSTTGAGLSVEAGRQWFGRLTIGRSMEAEGVALGGGYRWSDGQSVSMQFSRTLGSERLGLAVRYDWPRYYVRVGYELSPRTGTSSDTLRFSAGVRF
ncbi:MAG: hypothetical protein HY854_15370 [Burkholderiales bacterium]|nr:hypothetical protein [Burkholderiales bacterium]